MTALQDRETYTFWSITFMPARTRRMKKAGFSCKRAGCCGSNKGKTLRLLSAIPRAWLKDGQSIHLDRVASYFGPLTLESRLPDGARRITAQFVCAGDRNPKS